jgi:hypothetical protein
LGVLRKTVHVLKDVKLKSFNLGQKWEVVFCGGTGSNIKAKTVREVLKVY